MIYQFNMSDNLDQLINKLKDGDSVVVKSRQDRRYLVQVIKHFTYHMEVTVLVADPNVPAESEKADSDDPVGALMETIFGSMMSMMSNRPFGVLQVDEDDSAAEILSKIEAARDRVRWGRSSLKSAQDTVASRVAEQIEKDLKEVSPGIKMAKTIMGGLAISIDVKKINPDTLKWFTDAFVRYDIYYGCSDGEIRAAISDEHVTMFEAAVNQAIKEYAEKMAAEDDKVSKPEPFDPQ